MSPATELIEPEKLPSAKPPEAEFAVYRANIESLKATAETLTVNDETDERGMKLARETRLALKDVRLEIERRRKELKEESLRRGQRIDAAAREMTALIEPLESRMLEQERFAERQEAARRATLLRERSEAVFPYVSPGGLTQDLGAMSDEEFDTFFADVKGMHAVRLARAKREQEEAEAKARADAQERERILAENERLKAEAEKARKEQAIIDATTKRNREEAEAQLRAERQIREKAETELRAKQAAEEAKRKAEAAAVRKAANAPDKTKLLALTKSISDLRGAVMSTRMSTREARNAVTLIVERLDELSALVGRLAESL